MQGTDPIITIFITSALIMIALVSFIVFFVLVYQRRLLKQQQELQAQKIAHQQQLLAASIQTQENERQRIARDLHDEIGAVLSAVKMKVSQAKRKAKEDHTLAPMLGETTDMLTDSIQTVRRISHALLPPLLEKFGLAAALKDLVEKSMSDSGPRLHFEMEGESRRLPQEQELGLYRAAMEVMNNALKHAAAKNIRLRLAFLPEKLMLDISDDGKGFDKSTQESAATGLGLKNIESRILTIGGQLDFQSKVGTGTTIKIHIDHENRPG